MTRITIFAALFLSALAFADIPKGEDLSSIYNQAFQQHQTQLAPQQEASKRQKGLSQKAQQLLNKRFAAQLNKHGINSTEILRSEDLPVRDNENGLNPLFRGTVAHIRFVQTNRQVCKVTLKDTTTLGFGNSRSDSCDCEQLPASQPELPSPPDKTPTSDS